MSEQQSVVALATSTITRLFAKYGITDPAQAKRLIREKATQEDLEDYQQAIKILDGSGALG